MHKNKLCNSEHQCFMFFACTKVGRALLAADRRAFCRFPDLAFADAPQVGHLNINNPRRRARAFRGRIAFSLSKLAAPLKFRNLWWAAPRVGGVRVLRVVAQRLL